MRQLLLPKEAEDILLPHLPKIASCIREGFADYLSMIGQVNAARNRFFNSRTRAALVHNLIAVRAAEAFKDVPGVTAKEYEGVFGLHFKDQVFIRFKKFGADLTPSISRTRQAKRFENQQTVIPGFPRKPTLLYAGYTFNYALTGIHSIYLSLRVEGRREWALDITRYGDSGQDIVPFSSAPDNTVPRVKIKPSARGTRNAG